MIRFFLLEDNLYQVCIRDLIIYYSFKMPIAYRIKGEGLKIKKGMWERKHLDVVHSNLTYLYVDPDPFDFNLKYIFKSTIYNLAEDFTKERMNIKQTEKRKPIYIGELKC